MSTQNLISTPVHHDSGTEAGEGLKAWRSWLDACIRFEASDLIVKSGQTPKVRVRGALKGLQTECPMSLMFQVAKDILDESQYEHFKNNGSIDFAYDYDNLSRFRVNLFMARFETIKDKESTNLPKIKDASTKFLALSRHLLAYYPGAPKPAKDAPKK